MSLDCFEMSLPLKAVTDNPEKGELGSITTYIYVVRL